ncbi:hypothetical protein [Streptomyces sp. MST-110588]|uniref:hypothetical protein n=1 Tax=Streptomyces sp. MST-110588 TaxID=2833628 RepID=UPI001F5C287D|nr:hypothetical protein [Streptomyces sp. MST-110588]UNO38508.1 hypothetical protein KGS77_01155 [Streptomyces sp. MST-110588]
MQHGLRRGIVTAAVTATALMTLSSQAGATALGGVYGKSRSGCSEASGTYNYYDTDKVTPNGNKLYDAVLTITAKDLCPGDPRHNAARVNIAYWKYEGGLEKWHTWEKLAQNSTQTKKPKNVWNLIIEVCDWNPNDGKDKCARVA